MEDQTHHDHYIPSSTKVPKIVRDMMLKLFMPHVTLLGLLDQLHQFYSNQTHNDYNIDDFLLLNFPVQVQGSSSISTAAAAAGISMSEHIKKSLPIVRFGDLIDRQVCKKEESLSSTEQMRMTCVVCLNLMERREEMRELPNCRHVFHRECLDKWVDQCQITCPTCRSNLLPLPFQDNRHDHPSESL